MEKSVKRITLQELHIKLNACNKNIHFLQKEVQRPRGASGMSLFEQKNMSDRIVDLRKWRLVWSSLIHLYEEI